MYRIQSNEYRTGGGTFAGGWTMITLGPTPAQGPVVLAKVVISLGAQDLSRKQFLCKCNISAHKTDFFRNV
jgi:hypothetical protein